MGNNTLNYEHGPENDPKFNPNDYMDIRNLVLGVHPNKHNVPVDKIQLQLLRDRLRPYMSSSVLYYGDKSIPSTGTIPLYRTATDITTTDNKGELFNDNKYSLTVDQFKQALKLFGYPIAREYTNIPIMGSPLIPYDVHGNDSQGINITPGKPINWRLTEVPDFYKWLNVAGHGTWRDPYTWGQGAIGGLALLAAGAAGLKAHKEYKAHKAEQKADKLADLDIKDRELAIKIKTQQLENMMGNPKIDGAPRQPSYTIKPGDAFKPAPGQNTSISVKPGVTSTGDIVKVPNANVNPGEVIKVPDVDIGTVPKFPGYKLPRTKIIPRRSLRPRIRKVIPGRR